jgi:hypothetical protein
MNYIVAGWMSKSKIITDHVPRILSFKSGPPQENDMVFSVSQTSFANGDRSCLSTYALKNP